MPEQMADRSARFWGQVKKRGPDECWTWIGGLTQKGYGSFSVGGTTVNVLRGGGRTAKNAVKTHCPRGHPYSGDNLYLLPHKKLSRTCRICRSAGRQPADSGVLVGDLRAALLAARDAGDDHELDRLFLQAKESGAHSREIGVLVGISPITVGMRAGALARDGGEQR